MTDLMAEGCELIITSPHGDLLRIPMDQLPLIGLLSDGPVISVAVSERTDPDTGEVTGAFRYALETRPLHHDEFEYCETRPRVAMAHRCLENRVERNSPTCSVPNCQACFPENSPFR